MRQPITGWPNQKGSRILEAQKSSSSAILTKRSYAEMTGGSNGSTRGGGLPVDTGYSQLRAAQRLPLGGATSQRQQASGAESMTMKAFTYFASGASRSNLNGKNGDSLANNERSSEHLSRAYGTGGVGVTEQGTSQSNAVGDGDGGEFRCKSCLRGPPLTKKYAKNQCQTCYKKEKKIQKEEYELQQ